MIADDKAQLRQKLRAARLALPPELRTQYATQMLRHAADAPDWQGVTRIGSYCALRGEADPAPLNAWLTACGKEIYLPVTQAAQQLRFARWTGQSLRPGAFGIHEPELGEQHLAAVELGLLIMPLLGFDRFGTRLGAGAGYYDRALAGCPAGSPQLLGLAYSFQQMDKLPVDAWDVPLGKVLTELGIVVCAARRSASAAD